MNCVKFSISSFSKETVFGLNCQKFLITDVAWFWINFLRQTNVQVADGVLLNFSSALSCFPGKIKVNFISQFKTCQILPEEADSSNSLIVRILDPDVEWKTVLPEGMELVEQLIPRLGDGEQVAKELKVVSLAFKDFNIP